MYTYALNDEKDRNFLKSSKGSTQTIIELLQYWYFERPAKRKRDTEYGYNLPSIQEWLTKESRALVGEKRDPDNKIYNGYYTYLKKQFIQITKGMFKTIGADAEIKIPWQSGEREYMNIIWFKGFDDYNKHHPGAATTNSW